MDGEIGLRCYLNVLYFKIISLFLFIGFIPSCAFFSSSDNNQQNYNIGPSVGPTMNKVPIPLEVAKDIARINQGQTIYDEQYPTPYNPYNSKDITTSQKLNSNQISDQNKEEIQPTKDDEDLKNPYGQGLKHTQFRNPSSQTKGSTIRYEVKKGDTLMKISYEKYGSLFRWRDIYETNQAIINSYNFIVPGMILTIHGVEYIVMEHNGKPYLIKRGDTLIKISNKLYGLSHRWRYLWNSNPKLIKDPNKIYSGFTLYYE